MGEMKFLELDGCVWVEGDPFMRFYRGETEVELDGKFTVEELQKIIDEMICPYCKKPKGEDKTEHIVCGAVA